MALGLRYGRTEPGAATPGMFEAARELHDRFKLRRRTVCCRSLIRRFEFGAPEHIDQCITITGEVAADVVELLSRGQSSTSQAQAAGHILPQERDTLGMARNPLYFNVAWKLRRSQQRQRARKSVDTWLSK